MHTVAVDILGSLPVTPQGNCYVLVVMDYFTKLAETFSIPDQEAKTIAAQLVDDFFLRFSPPEHFHSDQGRQFESTLVAEICKCLGIKKTRTTAYHPQSDRLVERFNHTLQNMLAMMLESYPTMWENHWPPCCIAHTSPHQQA